MSKSIRLPAITADFEAGTISAWHKSVGDNVEKGDVILDVETDKAVVEVEASDSGILGRILMPAGSEDVAANTIIGILLEAGESIDDVSNEVATAKQEANVVVAKEIDTMSPPANAESDSTATSDGRLFASPLARRIAAQQGLDLAQIKGRGPNKRILKADVELALTSSTTRQSTLTPQTLRTTESTFTTIKNSNIRKVVARRLTEAKQQIPHYYLSVDCEIDALLDIRQQINERHESIKSNIKVSVNDCIVKAAALALRDVPAANASWTEDAIQRYDDVDIAVAVATDNGLITPVVRQADLKPLDAISIETKDLAKRANLGRLQPNEYKGGGFTISNLGMFGIKEFSAIINPPQSCILALGMGERRPIVRGEAVAIATLMSCTLSVDHRSVDGAIGATYLRAFKQYIEKPALLLLGI